MRYFATSHNRDIKAKKIEAVLCDYLSEDSLVGKRILDLGCGSGHIALYFARRNKVIGADVVDQRTITEGNAFSFVKLDTSILPFDDGSFDIVIANHVLFCLADQAGYMKEIRRVLKQEGVCYVATANRNFPVEGFTKIPLLHYLPESVFRPLYHRIRKTDINLHLLRYRQIVGLLADAGFVYKEYTVDIMKHAKKYGSEYSLPFNAWIPSWLSPTVIFVLQKT